MPASCREFRRRLLDRHVVERRPMREVGAAAAGHDGAGQDAVDLDAIGDAAIRKRLGERDDRGVDRADGRIGRLREKRRIARHQHDRPSGRLQRRPGCDGQPARAVKLERQSLLPLPVGHLEQIDLRHRAGDIEQRVDPAERRRASGRPPPAPPTASARSRSMMSGSASAAFTACRGVFQLGAVARHQHDARQNLAPGGSPWNGRCPGWRP